MTINRTALIKKHLDAQTKDAAHEVARVPIRQGLPLPVALIPVKDLRFNPNLGRVILERLTGKKLDGTDTDKVQKEIERILLEQTEAKELRRHLIDDGQLQPGIATADGYLINGNRRLAVLRQLWVDGEMKEQRYQFMRVGVLPNDITAAELYLLEVKLQMTPDVRVKYGPFTALAQARWGLDKHKVEKPELAAAMDISPDGLEERLQLLQIVDEYLNFIKRPGAYDLLEKGGKDNTDGLGKYEHFLTLKALKDKQGSQPYWESFQRHLFQMIRGGEPYTELRKVKKWKSKHYSRFVEEVGGKTPKLPLQGKTTKKSAGADSAIADIAAGLNAINESVAPGAAAIAASLPVPAGPTKPEKGGVGDPDTDQELETTLSALSTVNDVLDTEKVARRPLELLKQALTKLEAFNSLPNESLTADASEIAKLITAIEKTLTSATKRLPKKKSK